MIFINYRIHDSNDAVSLLEDKLVDEFGDKVVFRDKSGIQGGDNFDKVIKQKVVGCQVMLVVIGKIWKTVAFTEGEREGELRLDDPDDWVRREILLALEHGKHVIPVLLNGEVMPDAKWLARRSLQELSPKQALPFRMDDRDTDFPKLVALLRVKCPQLPARPPRSELSQAAVSGGDDSVGYYLRRLTEETANIRLLGLGRSLQIDLPIKDAYIPLQTMLSMTMEQQEVERFPAGRPEQEQQVELADVFQHAARRNERGVILLGEPGSGKTTGARQLAWQLASGQTPPAALGLPKSITPVLLRFRNLKNDMLTQPDGLRLLLHEETRCLSVSESRQNPGNELWAGRAGGLLWILDGLDEVIDPVARKVVAEWIRSGMRDRLDDWFLVTCRFQGYLREGVPLGPRFIEFHVRPLDDDQIQRFVHDWFHAAYAKLLGPGPSAVARAEEDSGLLLERLSLSAYQLGRMRELARNPLLLTILCIVFQQERNLPTGRAELYAHCVKVLLEHWRRGLYAVYDPKGAQSVLARIAWWMHQQQDRTSAPLGDLIVQAERGLADVAESSGLGRDGDEFIRRMREEAGILALSGDGSGHCGFLHLSFQEYLAAEYAATENQAPFLARHASESWWREVALLSLRSSRSYCESFFRGLLAGDIANTNADLFDRCLNEALHPVGKPFLERLRNTTDRPIGPIRRLLRACSFWTTKTIAPRQPIGPILRLLRGLATKLQQEERDELEQICRNLAATPAAESSGYARDILIALGVELPQTGPRMYLDERTGITFHEIPAGEFFMGEGGERHPVRLSSAFWLAKYPVTNAQYALFLKATSGDFRKSRSKVQQPAYWDDRRFNQPEQPVIGVSWDDAQAYCRWAGYRLPTEAEWEYACRAGSDGRYCFGDDEAMLGEYGWFDKNSNGQTQPVGTKQPNTFGLYDMHGNVWEWCQDWYGKYSTGSVIDPTGPDTGSFRVRRGGSWSLGASICRSARRSRITPGDRYLNLGFRLAAVPSSE